MRFKYKIFKYLFHHSWWIDNTMLRCEDTETVYGEELHVLSIQIGV